MAKALVADSAEAPGTALGEERNLAAQRASIRLSCSRLEHEGLAPSPEAERTTLLRRVTLDLTGLPPTPAETNAFLADKIPTAYEKVVDRLLASPRYGERMAIRWLRQRDMRTRMAIKPMPAASCGAGAIG